MIALNFEKMNGLLPAIAQDHSTGEVLMLGFMNEAAWQKTVETGYATYYSRTRDTLWTKGETSGHQQIIQEIRVDCDNDTVLLKVKQRGGAACHTGHRSCFYQVLENESLRVDGYPVFDPKEVYRK
jgi:phosphoribosyl-AMP cyclohydrolase